MKEIKHFIISNPTESIMILGAAFIVMIVFLLIITISLLKDKKYKKKYLELVGDIDVESIEEIVKENNNELVKVKESEEYLKCQIKELETKLSLAVQNVGLIRYNAFGEMGPELSFSIALLDQYMNGLVLTSIHGREQSACFSKPIVKGKSEHSLSVEEMQAINKAVKGEFYSNSL